jgi:DNA (cytosine-5)-methyltransferase 1
MKFLGANLDLKRTHTFTFSDICAGIGGMRLAFENLGGSCIFASEWDKFCQQTYIQNFGDRPHGDLMKIPLEQVHGHDVLLAGFPCQPFSKGGAATRRKLNMRSGFSDNEQGRIFFRIVDIIKKAMPKAILLENVPQIEKLNGGRTINAIIRKLEELGYGVNYKVICSDYVVPQRRSRLYLVALAQGQKFEFPEIPDLRPVLRQILEDKVGSNYTLSDRLWKWLQKHADKHKKLGNGYCFRLADRNGVTCTLSARYGKDGSEILIPQRGKNPRKLTPRECARLMGFPDSFNIPVSDTQAYKQFGNSVVIPVIYLIGYQIVKSIRISRDNCVICPRP